jgi:hypothetical protein
MRMRRLRFWRLLTLLRRASEGIGGVCGEGIRQRMDFFLCFLCPLRYLILSSSPLLRLVSLIDGEMSECFGCICTSWLKFALRTPVLSFLMETCPFFGSSFHAYTFFLLPSLLPTTSSFIALVDTYIQSSPSLSSALSHSIVDACCFSFLLCAFCPSISRYRSLPIFYRVTKSCLVSERFMSIEFSIPSISSSLSISLFYASCSCRVVVVYETK